MFREGFNDSSDGRDLEKDNLSGRNTEDSILENTPVRVLTAASLIGDKVENFKGEHLGNIKDIMLDIERGSIEYVVIEFGGFLGIGGKLFAIPHKALAIDPGRKVVLINRDREYLKKAPGFDKDHWPETNSKHFEEVNNFWGYAIPKDNADAGFSS